MPLSKFDESLETNTWEEETDEISSIQNAGPWPRRRPGRRVASGSLRHHSSL